VVTHRIVVATAALAAVLASGCAVINPYVRANDERVRQHPTLDDAVVYAANTRQAYYDAIRDHTAFNRGAGLMIVGLAGAAAGLGITGGSSEDITALALGGAGLFGMSRVLYSDRRLRIYAAGAQAITCTLGAFEGLRAIDGAELQVAVDDLDRNSRTLRGHIEALPALPRSDQRVVRAETILSAAEATVVRGRGALSLLRTGGVRIYDAVESTRAAVTDALVKTEPDLAEIVATANQSLRANAGLLAGRSFEPAAPVPEGKKLQAGVYLDDILRIEREARIVEMARARVDSLLAAVGTPPTAEQLKACAFDAEAAGLTFFTEPQSTVVVDAGSTDKKATVAIRGGKPPYHAQWVGSVPGTDVTLEPIDHGQGGKQGTLVIKADPAAVGRSYQLLVTDEGAGRASLTVVVVAGKGGGGSAEKPAAEKPAQPAPAKNDAVERMQRKLIGLGCLPAKNPNGQPSDDGIWGDATAAAAKSFYVANRGKPEDFDGVDANGKRVSDRGSFGDLGSADFLGKFDVLLNDPAAARCPQPGGGPPASPPTSQPPPPAAAPNP